MTTTASAAGPGLPPEEAIAFLRQKVNIPTRRWDDLWEAAHSRGFMVAGAASQALVGDFREAVAKALEQGTTLAEFRKDFDAIVAKHGWEHNGTPAWRSQIIYETNLSMAYSAGRYKQMTEPDTLAVYPYWQYQHTSSARPRPAHLAWVGTTLRYDDPWWGTHYPPNGWRCRCSVRPVSGAALRRQGKTGPDQAPPVDLVKYHIKGQNRDVMIPKGIDPGFGYNPGASWLGRDGPGRPGHPKATDASGLGHPAASPPPHPAGRGRRAARRAADRAAPAKSTPASHGARIASGYDTPISGPSRPNRAEPARRPLAADADPDVDAGAWPGCRAARAPARGDGAGRRRTPAGRAEPLHRHGGAGGHHVARNLRQAAAATPRPRRRSLCRPARSAGTAGPGAARHPLPPRADPLGCGRAPPCRGGQIDADRRRPADREPLPAAGGRRAPHAAA